MLVLVHGLNLYVGLHGIWPAVLKVLTGIQELDKHEYHATI